MARFIRVAVTDINGDGEPLPSDRDEWINVDQITSIREMLSHNLARRHRLNGAIPPKLYPLLELRTADRRTRLISLGTYPDAPTGMAALNAFIPAITAPAHADLDAQLARLLQARETIIDDERDARRGGREDRGDAGGRRRQLD